MTGSIGRVRLLLVLGWLLVLVIDLVAGSAVTRLRYDDGLHTAFVSDSPWFDDYERFASSFTQSHGDAVVLFRASDFARGDALGRVRDFALDARLATGVSDVISVFSLRRQVDGNASGQPFLPAELPTGDELAALLQEVVSATHQGGRLVTPERDLTAVVVALHDADVDTVGVRVALAELDALVSRHLDGSGVSSTITGVPPVRQAIMDGLRADMLVLNLVGLGLGLLVCVIALPSLPLAMLSLMPSCTALIWALGALSLLGYDIDVVSVALPVLVLVLSFADSLHLTFEVGRLRRQGASDLGSVVGALRRVGPACALASITTAIAFAGLTFSESAIIRDLGQSGLIATLVALVAVLITQPLLLATVAVAAPQHDLFAGGRGTPGWLFDWSALPRVALRLPAVVVVVAFVGILAGALIYSQVETRYSALENFDRGAPVIRALDEMSERLGAVTTVDVIVPIESLTSGQDLARVQAVHDAVVATVPGAPVASLALLAPAGGSNDERAVRVASIVERMPDNQRGRLVSHDETMAMVRLHVADPGATAMRDLVQRLEDAIARSGVSGIAITGFLAMSAFVSDAMIADLNACFLLAVGAAGLLTMMWFRNPIFGLVALVPNVLPILLVGAWLVLSGRGLQFTSGIALTIAFGIAVDDTVHVLNRLRLAAPPDRPFDLDAIRLAMEEVTPVLVVTTAVLSIGLIGTFFATIPTVTYFGALSIAVFLLAILADLIVLPACLAQVGRARFLQRQQVTA